MEPRAFTPKTVGLLTKLTRIVIKVEGLTSSLVVATAVAKLTSATSITPKRKGELTTAGKSLKMKGVTKYPNLAWLVMTWGLYVMMAIILLLLLLMVMRMKWRANAQKALK